MPVTVGVPRETYPGERRVAITPRAAETLIKGKVSVVLETSAGLGAGFTDEEYTKRGVRLGLRSEVFRSADIIAQARALGANPTQGRGDITAMRPGQMVIGFGEPLTASVENGALAAAGVTFLSMELVPRITRAQSMDALSSMASIAGYEAVIIAAGALPKMFPMMSTAAGTIAPAKLLVLGAGVAGLQAIATARRLGAVVLGYDIRAAVREQIESLGAKFVVLDLDASAGEGQGGYAKAMDEAFYKKQRELLGAVIREQDVVITTAAVPGRRAPILVTAEMTTGMQPGSVIIDIAAERGGNCELTRPGETVIHNGIHVIGPVNMPSLAPTHASQMYANNIVNLLKLMLTKEGELMIDMEDEVIREAMVCRDGRIINPRVLQPAA